jgi:hypothetical protein
MKWQADTYSDAPSQVWPIDDLKPHVIDGGPCWCEPRDVDGIIVHNSLDGREAFEQGERKAS